MRSRLNMTTTAFTCVATSCLAATAAVDAFNGFWEARLGKPAPLVVATAATGPWSKEYPFHRKTYGLTRGFCRANLLKSPGIVVYARTANDRLFALASRLDRILADHGQLEGCFIHLFDEKGAQFGGYSADELEARIAELRGLAERNKLERVSLGVAASASAGNALGLGPDNDVVILFLKEPDQNSKGRARLAWYRLAHTRELDDNSLATMEGALRTAIGK